MNESYMNTDQNYHISNELAKENDSHWEEVLRLAEKYGFIRQAAGGTAILITHENIIEGRQRRNQPERSAPPERLE